MTSVPGPDAIDCTPNINGGVMKEVDCHDEDLSPKRDSGILRRILVKGKSNRRSPNKGAKIEVKLIGRINGTEFDNREVKFILGKGMEHQIPEGLEIALGHFERKEKSLLKLQPKYGFGSAGLSEKNVPPGVELEYEVELTNFNKSKEVWEMNQEEKIEHASIYKERGTYYFKKEKFRLAVEEYNRIIDLLENDSGLDKEKKCGSFQVLLAGYLNLSQCYLNIKYNIHAKENAQKALEMDDENVKALFRNGQALLNLEETVEAHENFKKCLSLDPTNKAAANQVKICQAKLR